MKKSRARVNRGRVAAAKALVATESGGSLEDFLAEHAPTGNDRGLAWFVALGVLRHRGRVDAALRPRLSRPLHELDSEVRAILRVGAFELLFARTPRHAAVSQAVELTRALGVGRARGFVNAVLRRTEPATELARPEELDHPDWLVARWDARYGEEATEAACRRHGTNPPLCLVLGEPANQAKWQEAWGEAGCSSEPAALFGEQLPGAWVVSGHQGPIPGLPGFAEGAFWVQDPAAVAVADLCSVTPGMTVLDACAAPGGKSFRLLSQGAVLTATDRSPTRLERVQESLARLGMQARVQPADWEEEDALPGELFDCVLLDAPCTALGTLRRNPEVRWRRQPQDPAAMARVQWRLLKRLSARVAPGGSLVYAVCSTEPEEGEAVVHQLLQQGIWACTKQWHTFPGEDADGFFAARLERT